MIRTSSSPVGPGAPLRVVFMGTPDYGVPTLMGLIAAHEVVASFAQPDRRAGRGRRMRLSPVKQVAIDHDIPVYQPSSLRKDRGAVEALRSLHVDLIVVAAYGLILPPEALAAAPLGAVNVHASLLPRWRGAAPVNHAILAGDLTTGVTIMQMDPGLDTGPVLATRETAIGHDETAGELTRRLGEMGADLLLETLPRLSAGSLEPRVQDDRLVTLAPRLAPADGRLDWRDRADSLARRVRAMCPWPGAYASMPDGARLKVHAATAVAGPALMAPSTELGTVQEVDGTPVVVARDGCLRLDVVQAPGRRPMPGADFLRGRAALVGARLLLPDDEAAP